MRAIPTPKPARMGDGSRIISPRLSSLSLSKYRAAALSKAATVLTS